MKPRSNALYLLTILTLLTIKLNASGAGAVPVTALGAGDAEADAAPASAGPALSERTQAFVETLPQHIRGLLPPFLGGVGREAAHNRVFQYVLGLPVASWDELGAKGRRRLGHRADEERFKLRGRDHRDRFLALQERIEARTAMSHEEFVRKVWPHLSKAARKLLPQESLPRGRRDRFGGRPLAENEFYLGLREAVRPRTDGSLSESDIRRAVAGFGDRDVAAARKRERRLRRREIAHTKRADGAVHFRGGRVRRSHRDDPVAFSNRWTGTASELLAMLEGRDDLGETRRERRAREAAEAREEALLAAMCDGLSGGVHPDAMELVLPGGARVAIMFGGSDTEPGDSGYSADGSEGVGSTGDEDTDGDGSFTTGCASALSASPPTSAMSAPAAYRDTNFPPLGEALAGPGAAQGAWARSASFDASALSGGEAGGVPADGSEGAPGTTRGGGAHDEGAAADVDRD